MTAYSPEKRTALVFCGSGADGAYHAGALRALQEAGVKIDVVAGHGVGAACAALAAIDGGARLWDEGGLWRSGTVARFYRWKSDEPRRVEHEFVIGDVNGDGFVDVTALDAAEQMAEILTFSQSGKLRYGTAFEVFETKMFAGGEPKEFEPNMGLVTDITGDGKDDLVLMAHDRVLIYPQQTKPSVGFKFLGLAAREHLGFKHFKGRAIAQLS